MAKYKGTLVFILWKLVIQFRKRGSEKQWLWKKIDTDLLVQARAWTFAKFSIGIAPLCFSDNY